MQNAAGMQYSLSVDADSADPLIIPRAFQPRFCDSMAHHPHLSTPHQPQAVHLTNHSYSPPHSSLPKPYPAPTASPSKSAFFASASPTRYGSPPSQKECDSSAPAWARNRAPRSGYRGSCRSSTWLRLGTWCTCRTTCWSAHFREGAGAEKGLWDGTRDCGLGRTLNTSRLGPPILNVHREAGWESNCGAETDSDSMSNSNNKSLRLPSKAATSCKLDPCKP